MTRFAGSALSRATTALQDADLHLAVSVIASDEQIDALRRVTDERAIELLSGRQPAATDLLMVVTTMAMISDLERMGDLGWRVGEAARLGYSDCAIGHQMRFAVLKMGQVAQWVGASALSGVAFLCVP